MQTICLLSKLKGVRFELEWAAWGMEPSWAELSWAEAGVQGRGNRGWAGEGWVQGLFELSWRRRQKVEGRLGEQGRGRLNRMKRRTGSEESKQQQESKSHIQTTDADWLERWMWTSWVFEMTGSDAAGLAPARPSSPVSTQVIMSTNTEQRENPWQKWRAWQ